MNSYFKNWRQCLLLVLAAGALSQSAGAFQGTLSNSHKFVGDIGIEVLVGQKVTLGSVLQQSDLVIDSFGGSDWQSKLGSMLARLEILNPSRSHRYQKRLEGLLQGTRFLPSVTLQYEGRPPLFSNLEVNSVQKTLAVLYSDPLPLQPELIVDQGLWNQLDENQRAMVFFEVLVDLELRETENDKQGHIYPTVWKFVDSIISVNSKILPQHNWREFLFHSGFTDADWNRCRIGLREYGNDLKPPVYNLQFLDSPCSVSIQGQQGLILMAKADSQDKWLQVTLSEGRSFLLRNGNQVTLSDTVGFDADEFPITGKLSFDQKLNLRNGQAVTLKGSTHFDSEGYVTEGVLAFPQSLQTGSHLPCRCDGDILLYPNTGSLQSCSAELPARVTTPTQDLTLVLPPYEDNRPRVIRFFENGEWNMVWSWLGDIDARGKLLLTASTGKQWIQGTIMIRSKAHDGHARFKLDQDIQYSLYGVNFSAKTGDTVPVFIDKLGAALSGGLLSQDTTIQTPRDGYELGGGRCSFRFGKTYDSLVDFFRDGSLATGVLLGSVLLKLDASDWHDGSGMWTKWVRGPVRVNLDPKGFQNDFEEYVCGNSKELGDEQ